MSSSMASGFVTDIKSILASEVNAIITGTLPSSATTTTLASLPPTTPAQSANPFTQQFSLLYPDGSTFNTSIADLNAWYSYGLDKSTEFGVQIGVSFMLLAVLLVLTQRDKLRTLYFALNASALAFNIIRLTCGIVNINGPFFDAYAYFAEDYSNIPSSAYAAPVIASIFTMAQQIVVENSLLTLAKALLCVTLRKSFRYTTLAVSFAIAGLAVVHRCYLESLSIISILQPSNTNPNLASIESTDNAINTANTAFFSIVFMAILGRQLYHRRKAQIKQFGIMQILFIGGAQTLLVPGQSMLPSFHSLLITITALFSAVQYAVDSPAIGSWVLTLTSVFLPFSALWAQTTTNAPASDNNNGNAASAIPLVRMSGRSGSGSGDGTPAVEHETV